MMKMSKTVHVRRPYFKISICIYLTFWPENMTVGQGIVKKILFSQSGGNPGMVQAYKSSLTLDIYFTLTRGSRFARVHTFKHT